MAAKQQRADLHPTPATPQRPRLFHASNGQPASHVSVGRHLHGMLKDFTLATVVSKQPLQQVYRLFANLLSLPCLAVRLALPNTSALLSYALTIQGNFRLRVNPSYPTYCSIMS